MNAAVSDQRFAEMEACERDRFCRFVKQHGAYSDQEVDHLQQVILSKRLTRVLHVSASLAVWSMLAAWMDGLILPVLIIYAISIPGSVYLPIAFPVVWTILNATAKFFFVGHQLGDAVKTRDRFLAVLPYAGAAFLMKNWFVGDALLRDASLAYIKFQKKVAIDKILNIFRRNHP